MQTTTNKVESTGQEAPVIESRIEETNSLAGLFGFFSRCIEEEVDAEFINLIRNELRQPLEASGLTFNKEFYDAPTEDLVETLAEEYTGLFVAPGCVSPYASVFETGCMFKEPADKAVAAYRKAGWDYKNRLSGEFPDHIGTMLGFYGILAAAESEHLLNGEINKAAEYKEQRETFLLDQLSEWGPGWCHRAAEAAYHSFYKNILLMIEGALWGELKLLVERRHLRELAELNKREPKRLDYDADFRKASGL